MSNVFAISRVMLNVVVVVVTDDSFEPLGERRVCENFRLPRFATASSVVNVHGYDRNRTLWVSIGI